VSVVGTRLAILLFPVLILLGVLVRFGFPEAALKRAVAVGAVILVLSTLTMILGNLLLVRDTSRYTGETAGSIDVVRAWKLIECMATDIMYFRRW
jgi:hypothetical protein